MKQSFCSLANVRKKQIHSAQVETFQVLIDLINHDLFVNGLFVGKVSFASYIRMCFGNYGSFFIVVQICSFF